MTIPGWMVLWSVPLVYHAAFLSGIRPARWYGTRLLPVAGAIPLAFFVGLVSHWSLIAGAALSIGLNVLVWIAIQTVAENRDYA